MACLPLFAGLRRESLTRLGQAARLVDLPGHRAIFSAGQPIRDAHFLASGSVKRFAMRSDNVEKVLELVEPGSLFALSEVFAGTTYDSFAETLKPSVLLTINRTALQEAAAIDSALAIRLLQAMAQALRENEFDHQCHRSLSVAQRVLDYLLGLAGDRRQLAGETTVQLGVSKRLIAARLDMAPETFSRTLRQLSDDGRIVVQGRTVHIRNATLAVEERSASGSGGVSGSASGLALVRYSRHERGKPHASYSAVELVNLSGRHRMLAHQITNVWLMAAREADAPTARVALRKYRNEFVRNLARLGKVDWPAGLREQRAVLESKWQDFLAQLCAPESDTNAARQIFLLSEAVFESADTLTRALVSRADGDHAQRVNIAGRNRMLCTRIVKLSLFSGWGVLPEVIERLFSESVSEFQRNLDFMRAASRGSPEIRAQLGVDAEQWHLFLEVFGAGKPSLHTPAQALEIFRAGEALHRHADATVKLFELVAG